MKYLITKQVEYRLTTRCSELISDFRWKELGKNEVKQGLFVAI